MTDEPKGITILMVDDDDDDRYLAKRALTEAVALNQFIGLPDGLALLDYLYRAWQDKDLQHYPRPDLILLDLNMPRKTGFEALEEMHANGYLPRIPVVILTSSDSPQDKARCRDLGAKTLITKPATYRGWLKAIRSIPDYSA